jgi:hypothetical protein
MADPRSEIELQLKRPVTTEKDDNDRRKKLILNVVLLNPAQAEGLLTQILADEPGDWLPWSFRYHLDRETRLEFLQKLAARLGHLKAEDLDVGLEGDGPSVPAKPYLQKGLRTLFPEAMKGMREQFLQSLRDQFSGFHPGVSASAPGRPAVLLEFRNNGLLSLGNKCPDRGQVPSRGLGPDPNTGKNWMEIRGNVSGHRPDAQYQFDRTIEMGQWYRLKDKWTRWYYLKAGTPDKKQGSRRRIPRPGQSPHLCDRRPRNHRRPPQGPRRPGPEGARVRRLPEGPLHGRRVCHQRG